MIDLIILDLHGTIFGIAGAYTPRNGFEDFMVRYRKKKFCISTDGEEGKEKYTTKILQEKMKILDRLSGVYTVEHLIQYADERRKDIQRVCNEQDVVPRRAVFIGNSPTDAEDAKRDGVKFIMVPTWMNRNERFSFNLIDLSIELPYFTDLRDVNI